MDRRRDEVKLDYGGLKTYKEIGNKTEGMFTGS